VVIDITGVPVMDATVANHLVADGRSRPVAWVRRSSSPVFLLRSRQTLVTIGVDLGKMNTGGDLQGGIEEAERRLGL